MTSTEDLSRQAVKLARRIQALPGDRGYSLILLKSGDLWVLIIEDKKGNDIEILK